MSEIMDDFERQFNHEADRFIESGANKDEIDKIKPFLKSFFLGGILSAAMSTTPRELLILEVMEQALSEKKRIYEKSKIND